MDWPAWIAGVSKLARGRSNKPRTSGEQLACILAFHRIECVFDIGANHGQYALSLRRHGYTGRIRSFEPLFDLHAKLRSLAAEDPDWRVEPPVVVGNRDSEIRFSRSEEDDMSSVLAPSSLHRTISPSSAKIEQIALRQSRLDSLIDRLDQRTHLKIDVQGYEPEVLDGAGTLLKDFVSVQLEMAMLPLYRGETLWSDMVRFMDDAGYELHLIIPGYFERKMARQLQIDGVFVNRAFLPDSLNPDSLN